MTFCRIYRSLSTQQAQNPCGSSKKTMSTDFIFDLLTRAFFVKKRLYTTQEVVFSFLDCTRKYKAHRRLSLYSKDLDRSLNVSTVHDKWSHGVPAFPTKPSASISYTHRSQFNARWISLNSPPVLSNELLTGDQSSKVFALCPHFHRFE